MLDIKFYETKDLVLKVNRNYDPITLNLNEWEPFIDRLCGDRKYQKEAISTAIIYLASGRYKTIEDLVKENYAEQHKIQSRYLSISDYYNNLQLANKLYANIDLATGTGKSYVIYGIAQIMLGLGLVDKVLVLCPSLTIETGLTEKFERLSSDSRLKRTIPPNAKIKNPRVVNANVTIKNGDICVENIHAVYERTGTSIEDSIRGNGERVLVLNDESHHIFNKVSGHDSGGQDIKKWKEFLLNPAYNFRYILGFTGTAYVENEYFNEVIYRYSLREAIEDRIVKNIEYVDEIEFPLTKYDQNKKFQIVYQNHQSNKKRYDKVKPISIFITKDISRANNLRDDFIEYICRHESISKNSAEKKVLIVTSANEHKPNLPKLKTVDDKNDPTEWIFSVSMLTEGWDVKNVFQIVPHEEKAFNSKLLIAQVLGRGLRVPAAYQSPQPKVIVFNHDSWSKSIKGIVDEVLEIETRITSETLTSGKRLKYHFEVHNLNYDKKETEVEHERDQEIYDYTRIEKEGIKLEAQVEEIKGGVVYIGIKDDIEDKVSYQIREEVVSIEEVVDRICDEFNIRDWEGRILKLGKQEYTQNNLPPRDKIKEIIKRSMGNVGIKGSRLVEKNKNKVLQAFSTLLRKKGKTVVPKLVAKEPYAITTKQLIKESVGVGNLRRDSTIFYTSNYAHEVAKEQKDIINAVIADDSLPRSAVKEQNEYIFRTPVNVVITKGQPERSFIEYLCKDEIAKRIDGWIKSRDTGFYSIEYTWRKGKHTLKNQKFNPDFFIRMSKGGEVYILVVEIKSDGDDSDENRAKYECAKDHFKRLNEKLIEQGIRQKYLFHCLSPNGYYEYFEYLKNGTLLKGQDKFRCELENLLETDY